MKHLIAHFEDLDGLACHVIGERWKPRHITHHDISYSAQQKPFKEIAKKSHILFCDLGYSRSTEPMLEEIRKHKKAGSKIDFYDHHNWNINTVQRHFDHIAHDKNKSSAQLLADHITPQDTFAKYLAQEARQDDIGKPSDFAKEVTDIIQSNYPFRKLITDFAYNEDITDQAKESAYNYRMHCYNKLIDLSETYTTLNINDEQYIIGLADPILYMKEGHRQIKKDNPEKPTIVFYENTKSAMFKASNQQHFEDILSKFNAGGRDGEGGITFETLVKESNYQNKANYIKRVLENDVN